MFDTKRTKEREKEGDSQKQIKRDRQTAREGHRETESSGAMVLV